MTHTHRKNDAVWRTQFGNEWAGVGAAHLAFHGQCDVTGAHVLVGVCTCGAHLAVCPSGADRPERRKWLIR